MEFFIQKSKLQDEMGRLAGVVDKKSTIPVLENSLLSLEGNQLSLTATDLDLTMFSECTVEQVASGGKACVPARRLFDIVKVMPEGLVKVTADANQWLKIQAKGSNFRIPGAEAGMFPETPTVPGESEWVYVQSKSLRSALKGVSFAASTAEDSRYALAGVKIEIRETEIRMVATDGHRLSLATTPLDDLLFNTMDTLLPGKAVGELSKLLTEGDGLVGIATARNGVFFKIGSRILHSRLLTGKFPTYQPFLDVIYTAKAVFKADVLAQCLNRTMKVVDQKEEGILIHFAGQSVSLYAQNADVGECYEVTTSNFNGGEFKIACSPRFLLDFLEQLGQAEVEFEVKDTKTQVHLRCVQGSSIYRYFLVPMRDKTAG